MKKLFLILILIPFVIQSQVKHPLTVEDLWAMKRVGSFDLSPDGKTIAFAVTEYDMDENKGNTDIYTVNSDGSDLHPLKNSEKNETDPKFSPDGKKIAFIRDGKIWTCNYDGSDDELIADISTGASGIVWSADGNEDFIFILSLSGLCDRRLQ